ncbi:endonuclease MutS2 [Oceanobacillus neutriphilus]|uniref:Endonuclease MutS2 n=1 Tax=Oceanobacillus neutriphilus TaxID=531815 RepID=A0ABQ2NYE5_9BACI|nr:endonuclease MutS2 [Oceanobacillus neutriphilus]GGP13400.1 endonuclease MutS2 [Oceanobacillus neutriphilus]
MNERVLKTLEFHRLAEMVRDQAETSIGKDLASKIRPNSSLEEVEELQAQTDEAVQIFRLNKVIPLGGISDIRPSVKRSAIGSILAADEVLRIGDTLYGGRQAKSFLEQVEDLEIPILQSAASNIIAIRDLEQHINSCIDDHGHIMDGASSTLRSIRSSIRTYESSVRSKLESYTRSNSKMLSDAIITIRNDRYVLPVKQEYRGAIGGIVHDQSSSGQTLFMEPKAVVDMNNKLQDLFSKEKQEVERILKELSGHIASYEQELLNNVYWLSQIDFISARGKLAQKMNAVRPKMNINGYIKMQQARHPYIPEDQVVANDIEMGEDFQAIVITGPNTGGKTVTLKMVGLCTLMAQSGLQVPALDGCEMPVFDEVFADIGDEQSIEQNLSTFSSHMTNIVEIMKHVTDQSLVLFDELGSGTDPQEGAALAMSILDEVLSKNASVIATTHYPELKAYGFNRKQVVNASVEFNVETLRPTYRLLLGVPGRSNAFEISKRLGLDEAIISHAKQLIGVDSHQVENMIASLEQSHTEAERDYEKAHELLDESEKLHAELKKAMSRWEDRKQKIYEKTEEKAEKALLKARQEAEEIVQMMRNMKNQSGMKEHEWIEARKMLDEAMPNLSKEKPAVPSEKKQEESELKPGDEIKLLTVNQLGEVVNKVNDKEYMVQVGIMKVKVKRSDLELVKKKKKKQTEPVATVRGSNQHVKTELDLRGERYEDAMHKLEKYVDDVLLAGYAQASIIHGKGTGALRKGVQEFVKRHPHIKGSRSGEAGEGGSGVTVIRFE